MFNIDFFFLFFFFLFKHLWGNMRPGNASYARWLCLNFMLLCSSFLDVTLLLQQSLQAVFLRLPGLTSTGNKPGQMWPECHSATARTNPPLHWEQIQCLWRLYMSPKVPQCNFAHTQNRISKSCNQLYVSYKSYLIGTAFQRWYSMWLHVQLNICEYKWKHKTMTVQHDVA